MNHRTISIGDDAHEIATAALRQRTSRAESNCHNGPQQPAPPILHISKIHDLHESKLCDIARTELTLGTRATLLLLLQTLL
jgi:hypothetical protein